MFKNFNFVFSKKKLFIFYGILNFLITNFILHLSLFFLPIIVSTALSTLTNILMGFYFYGKKVFKVLNLSKRIFHSYLLLSFCSEYKFSIYKNYD